MVASIREVARMSSAGVSWKPFGKRASGPVVLFDLAMQVTPSCGEWAAAAAYSGCGAERKVRWPPGRSPAGNKGRSPAGNKGRSPAGNKGRSPAGNKGRSPAGNKGEARLATNGKARLASEA